MKEARVLIGFHAVLARLRADASSVVEILADEHRHDARIEDVLHLAERSGVRVLRVPSRRLDGFYGGGRHQGIVARVAPRDERATGPYDQWPTARGFDRYYGFLNGETNQWTPNLIRDTNHVEPPRSPDEGYQLAVRIFSVTIIGFGLAILIVTLARGGGPLAVGFLFGLLFIALGSGRLYLSMRG